MVDTIFLIYNRCFTNCGYMKAIYFCQDLPLNESRNYLYRAGFTGSEWGASILAVDMVARFCGHGSLDAVR